MMNAPGLPSAADPRTAEELWRELSAHFTRFCAETDFLRRLAAENRWEEAFAYRVVAEYIRFLVLAKAAGGRVAPGETIDKAWHLHLIYSQWYWGEVCEKILRMPFHHFPAVTEEAKKAFSEDARTTLKLYRDYFGRPPLDIWGSVRRPRFAAGGFGAGIILMGIGGIFLAVGLNKNDSGPLIWGGVMIVLGVVCLIAASTHGTREKKPPGYRRGDDGGVDFGSYPASNSGDWSSGPAWEGGGHHGAHGHGGGHGCGGGHSGCGGGSSCGGGCGGGGGH